MSISIHSFIGIVDYQLISDSIKDLFCSSSSWSCSGYSQFQGILADVKKKELSKYKN